MKIVQLVKYSIKHLHIQILEELIRENAGTEFLI